MNNGSTIWDFFITRHKFSYLVIIVVVLLGIVSIYQIPKESNPEVDIPIVVVTTPFFGASAIDTEELVTNIIEDKLLSLDDIDNISSVSREGISSITVEFDPNTDSEKIENKVEKKVDEAKGDLPDEVEDSIITKVETTNEATLILSLSGPYGITELKKFAEALKDEIEKVQRVSDVNIIGGLDREIKVSVNKALLDGYGLGIGQVTSAIGMANTDIPTGSIKTAGADYTIRLAGRLLEAEDIKKVPVGVVGNTPVLVQDVADVIDGYTEQVTISKLSVNGSSPLPSVAIEVFKSKGGNVISVVDKVLAVVDEMQNNVLPSDVKVEVITDMAKFVRDDINNLLINGFQTVFLILLLLLLFVGTRESFIAGMSVPVSFLITFVFLNALGYSLNFLSLFALILSLGILIDTTIVVIERMNVYIGTDKVSPLKAASYTVREFQWPLITGTLTTVFAFLPMLLMSGIMGQYVKVIPITVTIILLSSLFVGLALITMLGARFLKPRLSEDACVRRRWSFTYLRECVSVRFFDYLISKYNKKILSLIRSRKKQKIFALVLMALLVGSLSLPMTGILKVNMFPPEDGDFFWVTVEGPTGTLLENTSKTMDKIDSILLKEPDIKSFSLSAGRSVFGGGTSENLGGVVVNLKEDRKSDSRDITEKLQKEFDKITGADISIISLGTGPPSSAPIDIAVKGDSLETLEEITLDLREILENIAGTTNIDTNIGEPKSEFVINIDRVKAQLYGISTVELAQVLRNSVKGITATVLRNKGDEVDVVVKYILENENIPGGANTISNLENITIATRLGDIPLSAFTETELSGGRPAIRHEDGKRTYRLSAYPEKDVAPIEIIKEFQRLVDGYKLPAGYTISYGGEQEDINQSYNDMFRAMILAVFLIASILILQFGSYRQPLFILSTIPLAFIGVFPGLLLMGKPFSFPAIIGLVALAGVVVNNGIILIDMMNKNRKGELQKEEAVVSACLTRFRPIILTTITTVVGILPVTLSSDLWGGLGYTIIFGLLVSSVFTLFAVPLLYFRFAEKKLD